MQEGESLASCWSLQLSPDGSTGGGRFLEKVPPGLIITHEMLL